MELGHRGNDSALVAIEPIGKLISDMLPPLPNVSWMGSNQTRASRASFVIPAFNANLRQTAALSGKEMPTWSRKSAIASLTPKNAQVSLDCASPNLPSQGMNITGRPCFPIPAPTSKGRFEVQPKHQYSSQTGQKAVCDGKLASAGRKNTA